MNKKHIVLIVDDDTDDREIIRDAFMSNHKDHRDYVFIESGDLLLEYLHLEKQHLPSLIMLDLNMPGKDGREVLREIKENDRFKSIPIIIFTTSGSERDKQTSYTLGANCFLTKPDTFNKLVDLTNSITQIWLSDNL